MPRIFAAVVLAVAGIIATSAVATEHNTGTSGRDHTATSGSAEQSAVPPIDTFTKRGVKNGSVMAEADCNWPESSVWIVVDGQGECIRYFGSGLNDVNELVVLSFHGDRLIHHWDKYGRTKSVEVKWYSNNNPNRLKSNAKRGNRATGRPYIFFSRPGVYGSSGDHKKRRRPREIHVINAAVDAIKEKYNITSFAMTGQSGGGHVVASLLALRNDIECAVPTSGVVAVGMRVRIKGWKRDATGYNDYLDPIDVVGKIPKHPTRRIFVVGDPGDSNVPFKTQIAYFEKVKNAGHSVWLVKARGRGKTRHSLGHVGRVIVGYCANGTPTDEILIWTHQESL